MIMLMFAACSGKTSSDTSSGDRPSKAVRPEFNADSAYAYVARQVAFGPRVPGTPQHRECARYIVDELARHGADTVFTQAATVTTHTGDIVPVCNIMARFNTSAPRRVLIAAHYDTRPWADNDPDESRRNQPILGANDGASGVGVILEMARNIGAAHPEVGVDFLLTDVEDSGSSGEGNTEATWSLGTQYWADNTPYTSATRPTYGIVLDMVGGRDAKFHREYTSDRLARGIVDKVWGTAAKSPYADRFPNYIGGAIVDDHLYINGAGIPCIDIVESANAVTGSFPPTWHTHDDNMDHIDVSTLKAVGETVMSVIYNEKN